MEPRSDYEDDCSPSFRTTPAGERLDPKVQWAQYMTDPQWNRVLPLTYNLECNGPNTRLILSGIVFREWSAPALKPRSYH
ncbi:hypothetical protein AVEN_42386-1 [Araneus ventricosus]|uniref:Uncharacterized protein n=1 Tax=Araneus ventricosus TaxID=182803 RepID=A0A4Y2V5Z0_ARAVE|nr:hypothetical protein AVEN_42386-1 [Araneus ventricosus]